MTTLGRNPDSPDRAFAMAKGPPSAALAIRSFAACVAVSVVLPACRS